MKSYKSNFVHFVRQIFHIILSWVFSVNNEYRTFETGYTRREIFNIFCKSKQGFEDDLSTGMQKLPSHICNCAVHKSWNRSSRQIGTWTMDIAVTAVKNILCGGRKFTSRELLPLCRLGGDQYPQINPPLISDTILIASFPLVPPGASLEPLVPL